MLEQTVRVTFMSYDWITPSLSGDSLLDSLCMEFPVGEIAMQYPPNDEISRSCSTL